MKHNYIVAWSLLLYFIINLVDSPNHILKFIYFLSNKNLLRDHRSSDYIKSGKMLVNVLVKYVY